MRIIRPYGESRTECADSSARRYLIDKTAARQKREIPDFALEHDELVIAQWISAIDKIASKPQGTKGATNEQRELRGKIGKACWAKLTDDKRLSAADAGRLEFLETLWSFKIHPYGKNSYRPEFGPGAKQKPEPKPEGRWFKAFAGDAAAKDADGDSIAKLISRHLYEAELRIHPGLPAKRTGRIEARAESIAGNVLRDRQSAVEWTQADERAYLAAGDPAEAIYDEAAKIDAAQERKKFSRGQSSPANPQSPKRRRVSLDLAAEALFAHWGKLFIDSASGKPMGIAAASASHPGLFALHMAVKECYRRLLRGHGKQPPVTRVLPRNGGALFSLIGRQRGNSDLNALVRLGRIIHYEASAGSSNSTAAIVSNWPGDVTQSRFWTSDGQAEIKRAEAFVRVWRHVLSYAALTLKSWASGKKEFQGDIVGSAKTLEKAISGEFFDTFHFDNKADLLFGNRADTFKTGGDHERKRVLSAAIGGVRGLRNTAFHFKGRGAFIKDLESLGGKADPAFLPLARRLCEADSLDRAARLKAMLRAAHLEFYFEESQIRALLGLAASSDVADLPLPRFSRVLLRAENAWGDASRLPPKANQRALEAPARLCQFTTLKLLYDRPFKDWLETANAEIISGWIGKAVERATDAAKNMNAKGDEAAWKVITARAAALPRPAGGDGIRRFFFDLSSETASEMRVQRGYESDSEKAREQAGFIDDLLCDVMILAFTQFIESRALHFVLDLPPDKALPEKPTANLDGIETVQPSAKPQDWQAMLYFLLHLVPVEEAGSLLHQLAKWEITAGRNAAVPAADAEGVKHLQWALRLYLDMHDAKFEGGAALFGCEPFEVFFEDQAAFSRVFPQSPTPEMDRHIPRRGLREVIRFGHLPVIKALAATSRITHAEIDRVVKSEAAEGVKSLLDGWHEERERLHDKWVNTPNKREFKGADAKPYCEALSRIVSHRRDAAHVRLTNHVRLHRVCLAVLARLVDYSGLFERDLYFVTLALAHRNGMPPDQLMSAEGLKFLTRGQIFFALDRLLGGASAVKAGITSLIGDIWNGPPRKTRNDLAHFNMLQGGIASLDLTHWVNQTRQLMGYDRKLKNAVSLSVKELLARHGLDISWRMHTAGSAHLLIDASLSSRNAPHLGKLKLLLKDGGKPPLIFEALHGEAFARMAAALFKGRLDASPKAPKDISAIGFETVDWDAIGQRNPQQNRGGSHAKRPHNSEKFRGKKGNRQ